MINLTLTNFKPRGYVNRNPPSGVGSGVTKKKDETKGTPKKRNPSQRYPPEAEEKLEELGFKLAEDATPYSYVLPIWSPNEIESEEQDDDDQA